MFNISLKEYFLLVFSVCWEFCCLLEILENGPQKVQGEVLLKELNGSLDGEAWETNNKFILKHNEEDPSSYQKLLIIPTAVHNVDVLLLKSYRVSFS